MIRWPLVTRKTHDAAIAAQMEARTAAVKAETRRCAESARAWAVELNSNLFQMDTYRITGAVRQALQDHVQIINYTPAESDLQPIKRLARPVRGAHWPEDQA